MSSLAVAAILMGLAFAASLVSVEAGLSVAIIEIVAGALAGNLLGIDVPPWLDFVASFGGILLTFLAGLEVDPDYLRSKASASLSIGGLSFVLPFAACGAFAFYVVGWDGKASLIAATALSTTSLAVVYAILVESGLNGTNLGRLLMASTFVTDFGTALALSALFVVPGPATWIFLAVSAVVVILAPRLLPPVFARYGPRVIEPEMKLLFAVLLGFMVLANWGASHAVLPVFVLGLSLSRFFRSNPALLRKLRVVAFAFVTPFFFLKGGMQVSASLLAPHLGLLAAFLAIKVGAKSLGVFPLARRHAPGHGVFTTLLMSTGLTFGTIASSYGLQAGLINRTQFSILVAAVIASAVVPTIIAQRWFRPALTAAEREEVLARSEEAG